MQGKYHYLCESDDQFLETFFPAKNFDPTITNKSFAEDTFKSVRTLDDHKPGSRPIPLEDAMYRDFKKCAEDVDMIPQGYKFAITADRPGPEDPSKQKVDVAFFHQSDFEGEIPDHGLPHWSKMRMFIEFKRSNLSDPFGGLKEEAMTGVRASVRAQVVSYAENVFNFQQRTRVYSIIIFGNYLRILMFDKAGCVVSARISYKKNPTIIGQFLLRFCDSNKRQQGIDTTALRIPEGSLEYALMDKAPESVTLEEDFEFIKRSYKESLDKKWPRWKLVVEGDDYLVGKPRVKAAGVVGRGTRSYTAYHVKDKAFCWLKDAWRVELPGIDKEGDVLLDLHRAGVEFVPTLLCHGDVEDEGGVQRTVSQDYPKTAKEKNASEETTSQGAKADGPSSSKSDEPAPTQPDTIIPDRRFTHYRMVVREVGMPLEDFENCRELVELVADGVEAHGQACNKAGYLHRDVSGGNMVIVPLKAKGDTERKRHGLLIDWEFAKRLKAIEDGGAVQNDMPRQTERTGTWQFQSARILNNPRSPVEIQDELESFFYIILYNGIRYTTHNCPDVPSFLYQFFDVAPVYDKQYSSPAWKKMAMATGVIQVKQNGEQLRFFPRAVDSDSPTPSADLNVLCIEHPLNATVAVLLSWFYALYWLRIPVTTSTGVKGDDDIEAKRKRLLAQLTLEDRTATAEKLASHQPMIRLLRGQAESEKWPMVDKIGDLLPKNWNPEKAAAHVESASYPSGSGRKRDGDAMQLDPRPEASKRLRMEAETGSDSDRVPDSPTPAPRYTLRSSLGSNSKGKGRAR
ncbi:uncharacterized protein LAESUDRAFT_674007 [Laetiporus sulphureus 93-53]|uniref:Fungal-type protein kinase domain-containing protein n=1 Tax=Laetiporus sulphureus 93-53 TaxID=1314785 RepID=A0A165GDE1_9APHY|nr:uncharacterized protein LAESUDRAFT_674007 [Laetiporus sulphureus 93-53]KZT10194.1 hypothetical protein LAESUDRAFT_674007 [Laetiporus sulphureus 93-53]